MTGAARPTPRWRPGAVVVASLGGFLFGYGTGVVAGALPLLTEEFALTPWAQGSVVSAALLGATLTAPTSGRLADRFGRRPVLAGAAGLYLLGTVLSAAAVDFWSLAGGRFLVGLALGATSFAVPMYIAEISPASRRGALVTLNQLLLTTGLLTSYVAALVLQPSDGWRAMFAWGAAPAAAFLVGIALVPESPRWLAATGQAARAGQAARRLGVEAPDPLQGTGAGRGQGVPLRLALRIAGAGPVALGLAIAILVHLTGLNTAIYYAPTILNSSGLTPAGGAAGAVVVGVCNIAAAFLTILLLDRWGRRPLMLGGLAVMSACAVLLGCSGWLSLSGGAVAVILCVFITAGATGPAAVFWVFVSEIYPSRARGTLMSLATAAHWGADFVVAMTFLPMVEALTLPGAFAVYAVACAVTAAILARWMRETARTSLPDAPRNLQPAATSM